MPSSHNSRTIGLIWSNFILEIFAQQENEPEVLLYMLCVGA
jgi:hypothetical protein